MVKPALLAAFTFQVIEHIKDDREFLKEIYRVLKPGGRLLLTTPNRLMTLTRNPWHVREYTQPELHKLAAGIFPEVEVKGVFGNSKVMEYYNRNKESVRRIMRFDFLDLQYRLPRRLLQIPYDIMNRLNRRKLLTSNTGLVNTITTDDFFLSSYTDEALDLYLVAQK